MKGTDHLCCVIRAIGLTQARIKCLYSPRACSAHCLHQSGALGKNGGMVAISHPHLPRLPVPLGVGSLWAESGRGMISSTAKVFTAASEQTCNTQSLSGGSKLCTNNICLTGSLISPEMLCPCKK